MTRTIPKTPGWMIQYLIGDLRTMVRRLDTLGHQYLHILDHEETINMLEDYSASEEYRDRMGGIIDDAFKQYYELVTKASMHNALLDDLNYALVNKLPLERTEVTIRVGFPDPESNYAIQVESVFKGLFRGLVTSGQLPTFQAILDRASELTN